MGRHLLRRAPRLVQTVRPSPPPPSSLTRTRRNPQVYRSALAHLSLAGTPSRCALVAAHIYDLRAAAAHGYTTVYVRRASEDHGLRDAVKCKAEGGEVDVVVDGLEELARLVGEARAGTLKA